jgi:hypothetical protein
MWNDNMADLVAISKMSKGICDCRLIVDHMIGACRLTYSCARETRHGNVLGSKNVSKNKQEDLCSRCSSEHAGLANVFRV